MIRPILLSSSPLPNSLRTHSPCRCDEWCFSHSNASIACISGFPTATLPPRSRPIRKSPIRIDSCGLLIQSSPKHGTHQRSHRILITSAVGPEFSDTGMRPNYSQKYPFWTSFSLIHQFSILQCQRPLPRRRGAFSQSLSRRQ